MAPSTATHDHTQRVGTFLGGWGGVLAVISGLALAFALSPLMNTFVSLVHGVLVSSVMSPGAATLSLYWLGMVSVGVGFLIALGSSDERIDRLRGGVGDWTAELLETLIVAGIALFWVFAGATWAIYADEFNTYEAAVELPAVGLMVLMIAGAVLMSWIRHRRAREARPPS